MLSFGLGRGLCVFSGLRDVHCSSMAQEVITEFRLLVSLAGYSAETPSDNLHLIKKLRGVLNPSLVKKVMLLDNPPTTLDGWFIKQSQSTATIE